MWALYPTTTSFAPAPTARRRAGSRRRPATTPKAPSAGRTARSSSRRCATATSTSTAWTPTARTCSASPTTPATTAARSSTPTARASCGARRARSPGTELDDYKRLLAQNLVRPTKLELYVANADGSERRRRSRTSTPRRSAPRWQPGGKRIIFASNYGDPQGREFDICGPSTSTARASSASRRRPASTASRCSRPTASASRSRRTARRRRARTTRTCSSPTGRGRAVDARRGAARRSRRRRHPLARRSRARGPRRRHAGPRRVGRVHRGALQELGLAARGRRRHLPPGLRRCARASTIAPATQLDARRHAASRSDAFVPAGFSAQRQGRRRRSCSRATASSTRSRRRRLRAASTCAARSSSCGASCPKARRFETPEKQRRVRRSAAQGLARARARRAGAARRRPAGAPRERARRLEAARRGRRCRGRGPRATPTRACPCCWSSAPRWRRCSMQLASSKKKRTRRRPTLEVALTFTTRAGVQRRGAPAARGAATGEARCRASSSSARTTITSASAATTRSRPTATCRTSAPTTTPRAPRRARGGAPAARRAPTSSRRRRRVRRVLGRGVGRARLDALHALAARRASKVGERARDAQPRHGRPPA